MQQGGVSFDFSNMFASRVGEQGLDEAAFAAAAARIPSLHRAMEAGRREMAWRLLPYEQGEVLGRLQLSGQGIRRQFETFVVLGIGGSALGSKALFSACCHPRYNELSAQRRGGPRFYVEDNVDPDKLNALFDVIDLRRTAFHIISKSGNTVETMSQFILVLDRLRQELGADWQSHIYVTTDQKSGIMKQIADENGWEPFPVPDGVGGRFSVLCSVGLLSATVLGLDIEALLAGAAAMDAACRQPSLSDNPAYFYALAYTEAMRRGINISVLLPYAESLGPLSEWYCQLWAESLGKGQDRQGRTVHCGQTPVRALGVTDQHSQIQLYNEGPFDKIISFIGVENFRTQLAIPQPPLPMPALDYLAGHSFNQLIDFERRATCHAVSASGKPNNTILVEQVNEYTLGKLFFFFEMATAAAGELLDINAFDQPGVEAGKIATFALMGRKGFERERAELSAPTVAGAGQTFRV